MEIGDGRKYVTVMASDGVNDGMWLELWDKTEEPGEEVLVAFWSDATGKLMITAYREDVPVELIDVFLKRAREQLRPVARSEPYAFYDAPAVKPSGGD